MISPKDLQRIRHITAYARKAIGFLGEADAAVLESNEEKLFAVIRAVEVVGEAATQVSDPLKKLLPDIPWGPAKAMRNLLIHAYPDINIKTLVSTVRDDFPPLIARLEKLLGEAQTL